MAGECNKKVLVIEDEPVLGRLCQRVLTADGFDVELVTNGISARKLALKKTFDYCVSDIRLPGITGMDLYKHWKKSGNPLADNLIFITGDTLNNNVQAFLENCGAPCILKPFAPEELATAVRQAVSKARAPA